MPWHKFRGAPWQVRQLLSFAFDEEHCRLFESYSAVGQEVREFTKLAELEATIALEATPTDPHLLSLWSPSVMPRPTIRTITLKRPAGGMRQVVEGCGLFQLQIGSARNGEVTEGQLGYWTEAGAKGRCTVVPGPESVDWEAHRILASKLKRHITFRERAR
jgi:hypothetical protein